jgi:hypothetical protein
MSLLEASSLVVEDLRLKCEMIAKS